MQEKQKMKSVHCRAVCTHILSVYVHQFYTSAKHHKKSIYWHKVDIRHAFYIIYEMNKLDNMKTTPFVPIVLETIQNSQNNAEKRLLSELLSNGSRDVFKINFNSLLYSWH